MVPPLFLVFYYKMNNMKINALVFVCAIFATHVCYSQNGTHPQVFGVPEDNPKFTVGQDHFNEFKETGIDYFTGLASFQVPLASVGGNFISEYVMANYSSHAIALDNPSSIIGTGWSLSVGASITREIRGNSDLEPLYRSDPGDPVEGIFNYVEGFFPYDSPQWNGCIEDAKFANDLDSDDPQFNESFIEKNLIKANYVDMEPDLYQLNIPGYSTPFHILYDKYWGVSIREHKLGVSITAPLTEDGEWTVILDNGIKYTFGGGDEFYEHIKVPMSKMGSTGSYQKRVTSWFVKEIEHPTGEKITFEYDYYNLNLEKRWEFSSTAIYNLTYVGATWDYIRTDGGNFDDNKLQKSEIKRITYTGLAKKKQLIFEYGGRNDIDGTKKLENIKYVITNLTNGAVKEAEKVTFNYHNDNNRLWLESIVNQVKKEDGTYRSKPPYKFEYYNRTSIPGYIHGAKSYDFWGFYNGVNNGGKTYTPYSAPAYSYNLFPTTVDDPNRTGSNRLPNGDVIFFGLMENIEFPSGAKINIEYEEHMFESVSSLNLSHGGGARVKKVTNTNDDNTVDLVKTIKYLNEDNETSGKLFSIPYFYYRSMAITGGNPNFETDVVNFYSPEPIFPLATVKGSLVGYKNVQVLYGSETDEDKFGFETNEYHQFNESDYNLYDKFTYPVSNGLISGKAIIGNYLSKNELYGKIKNKKIYSNEDGIFQLRKEKSFEYKIETVNLKGYKIWWLLPFVPYAGLSDIITVLRGQCCLGLCQDIIGKKYTNNHHYAKLVNESVIDYDIDGNSSHNQTVTYYANSKWPTQNSTRNSLNQKITTDIDYSSVYKNLPITINKSINGISNASKKLIYNDVGLLIEEYIGLSGNSIAAPEDFDENYRLSKKLYYSDDNKLKSVTTPGGKETFFINDPLFRAPVAKIENANSENDVSYTSFESDYQCNFSFDNSGCEIESGSQKAKTGNYYYNINSNDISIDLSQVEHNGDFILSLWTTNPSSMTLSGSNVNVSSEVLYTDDVGWSLLQFKINGTGNVMLFGSGIIDELRFYPDNAYMTTVTYDILDRVISKTSVNNVSNHNTYDEFGRLIQTEDENFNIHESIQYNYGN